MLDPVDCMGPADRDRGRRIRYCAQYRNGDCILTVTLSQGFAAIPLRFTLSLLRHRSPPCVKIADPFGDIEALGCRFPGPARYSYQPVVVGLATGLLPKLQRNILDVRQEGHDFRK